MDEKIIQKLDFLHAVLPELTSEEIIDLALLYLSLRTFSILEQEGFFEN